ncbi:MAG: hypothetical protein H5T33_00595 [Candidatus Methanosuratus sp.]|nr:hypothetical protein [Candidatus Methanosuratincola sp.]
MAKGEMPIIDALGALIVAVVLASIPSVYTGGWDESLRDLAEKEALRQEFYQVMCSGNATSLLDLCLAQGEASVGNISLSLEEPDHVPYVQFLSSRDGGTTVFYIKRRG